MSDVWKEIIVDWQGDLGFVADNLAGGTVQINSTDENSGLSPMELLLAGLAGCTGSDSHAIQLSSEKYCSASAMLGCRQGLIFFMKLTTVRKSWGRM